MAQPIVPLLPDDLLEAEHAVVAAAPTVSVGVVGIGMAGVVELHDVEAQLVDVEGVSGRGAHVCSANREILVSAHQSAGILTAQ